MPQVVEMQFRTISQQHQHHSGTCVITFNFQVKFYTNNMSGAISIKLHGFVLGNRPADVPKNIPKILAPGIGYTEI
jgi:hypothetical protein